MTPSGRATGWFGLVSFRRKILGLLILGNLMSSLLYSYSVFSSHWEAALRSTDTMLYRAAISASLLFGADFIDRNGSPEALSFPEHTRNARLLNDLAQKIGAHILALAVDVGSQTHIVAESGRYSGPKRGLPGRFWAEYRPLPEAYGRATATREPAWGPSPGRFGVFRCAFVPCLSAQGRPFMAIAGLPADAVETRFRNLFAYYLGQGLLFFLVPVVLVYWLLMRVSRSLGQVAAFTKELVSSDFHPGEGVLAGLEGIAAQNPDEIGMISGSLFEMQTALNSYVADLGTTLQAKEAIESELRIAHRIQMSILPRPRLPSPAFPQVDVGALIVPAKEVGGDFFDVLELDENHLFFSVGDVSGKGVPAAFLMAVLTVLMRTQARAGHAPDDILRRVNRELILQNDSGMFATALCGLLDTRSGRLVYAPAGHCPPVLFSPAATASDGDGGMEIDYLESGGIALGVLEDASFPLGEVVLKPGAGLVLYTDGITEAMSPNGELYEEERFLTVLQACAGRPCREVIKTIVAHVEAFRAGAEQSDDLTLLCFRLMRPDEGQEVGLFADVLALKASVAELTTAGHFVEAFWERETLPPERLHDALLLLEEAFVNSAVHAYEGMDASPGIRLRIGRQGDEVLMEIEDEGAPFDPLSGKTPDRGAPLADRQVGGWGIHLLRTLATDIDYKRVDGKNRLRLTIAVNRNGEHHELGEHMELAIRQEQRDGVVVVIVEGRVDALSSGQLEASLRTLLDQGNQRLIIQCAGIAFLSSAGLRVLLQVAKRLQAVQGRFVLAGVTPPIAKILNVTGFAAVFTQAATLEDALKSTC